jgi:hypothetical protein
MIEKPSTALVQKRTYPSLKSLLAGLIILFLVYAFISGRSLQFYASFVFFFYSVIGSMWLSVVCLGVFQTLLMVPLRVVNLMKSSNLEAYKRTIDKKAESRGQQFLIKQDVRAGRSVVLWYTISFLLQLVSYISIGRLFLIDFYTVPLKAELLYSWVPYPDYPIKGLLFKIPYLAVTETTRLGWKAIFVVWLVIMILQAFIYVVRSYRKRRELDVHSTAQGRALTRALTVTSGSTMLLMVGAWFLLTHFPTSFAVRIFSGSIAIPNRTFNFVTALATFFTIFWLDLSKIRKRAELAEAHGIDREVISLTQKEQLKDTVRNASLIGAGAFFITNHIPSAFELSIFTFEIISWLSPFTLDKIILAGVKKKPQSKPVTDKVDGGGEPSGAAENPETPPAEPARPAVEPPTEGFQDLGGGEAQAEKRSLSGEILIG